MAQIKERKKQQKRAVTSELLFFFLIECDKTANHFQLGTTCC